MLLNLSDVLNEQHKPIDVSVVLDLDAFSYGGEEFVFTDKSDVHLVIHHLKEKQFSINGECSITVKSRCDRCLTPVEVAMDLIFDKKIDLIAAEGEELEGFDESYYINGYFLDVDQFIYGEMLMGWPTKILCCEDCKGICNVCGQNLNLGSCDCEDTSLDPRMSVIQDIFKNFKEV